MIVWFVSWGIGGLSLELTKRFSLRAYILDLGLDVAGHYFPARNGRSRDFGRLSFRFGLRHLARV